MDALEDERRSDRPGRDRLLHRQVLGIEPAHEPDLHQPAAEGGLGVEDRRAVRFRGRERLFAEDGLAGFDRRQHERRMRRTPRGHDHRLDFPGEDEVFAKGEDLDAAEERSGLPRPRFVDIADRDHVRAGDCGRQPADMLLADHPDADDADVHCHDSRSPRPLR